MKVYQNSSYNMGTRFNLLLPGIDPPEGEKLFISCTDELDRLVLPVGQLLVEAIAEGLLSAGESLLPGHLGWGSTTSCECHESLPCSNGLCFTASPS